MGKPGWDEPNSALNTICLMSVLVVVKAVIAITLAFTSASSLGYFVPLGEKLFSCGNPDVGYSSLKIYAHIVKRRLTVLYR